MNHSSHQREEALYEKATELSSPAEREAFLIAECGGDESLLKKMRELLACEAEAEGRRFLPTVVAVRGAPAEAAGHEVELPGASIGPYKLREKIGEGGFGTVWVADQEKPVRRRVALKIIKLGMDTKEVIARFEQERQALAMMDHPNIAKVLDAGATASGRPYFVMELVRGVRITDFCDDQQLPMEERITLFITVCQAVQHAHQKGIIHRDLKPSNILVSLNDGLAVPKVIDFGVAKATQGRLTDGTIYTQFEQMIGTPLYMSPEQAQMTSLDIDTRSDIYALGVLLYELLTGRTPIDTATMAKAGMDEIRRLIREVDPPRPSDRVKTLAGEELTTTAKRRHTDPGKLTGTLSGDIDWIVMKCLEKDRNRRYDTANGLALDLQRHLAHEVVTARPPTTAYLLGKLVQRHRLVFAAGSAIAASLVLGLTAATWMYFREREALKQTAAERDAKEVARKEAEEISQFLVDVFESPDPTRDGREIKVVELLDKAAKELETDLATLPAQRLKLLRTLGFTYQALGLPQQSIPLLENVRDYCLTTLGPEHPDTLIAIQKLAISYQETSRRGEVVKMLEELLAVSRRVLGREHRDTIIAMHSLAIAYQETDRRDEALKLLEEVLGLFRKVLGPEDQMTLNAMQNLAVSYRDANRKDEALKMQEEVLGIVRRVLGPEHPNTLSAMHNLAVSYDETGRKTEALKLGEEVVELSRRVLGPEHPSTLEAVHNLAGSYGKADRSDEAIKLEEEVVELMRKALDTKHPSMLKAITNLARLYFEAGRQQEALDMHEEVLALNRTVNGPAHPDTISAMHNLAICYHIVGRRTEALATQEEVLGLKRKVTGSESPDTINAMNNLAISYHDAGRRDEALKLREEVLVLSRTVNSANHPATIIAMNNLAFSYHDAGRADEALKLREESLALNLTMNSQNHPDTILAMNNLAASYHHAGRAEEALKLEHAAQAAGREVELKRLSKPP